MKLSIKQLKQIIKEEVRAGVEFVGPPDGFVAQIMSKIEPELRGLVEALAFELSEHSHDSELDPDAFMPEVDGDVRQVLEKVIKEYE